MPSTYNPDDISGIGPKSETEPTSRAQSAKEKAAAENISIVAAQIRQRQAVARGEYEEATQGLRFTKDFNTHLEAVMRDPLATYAERYLAWLKRYSWGEWSLYAIGIDGEPMTQRHAANDLGIDERRISKVVDYYERRGYLYKQGKRQYPVLAPQLGPLPEKLPHSPEFLEFFENWKLAYSTEFSARELHRSELKRINKLLLSCYKKSPEYARKRAATLLKIARQLPDQPAGSESLSPYQKDQLRHRKREQQPENRPEMAEMQFDCRTFLFENILRMQRTYPNSSFAADPIDAANPKHQQLLNLLAQKLGQPDDEEYYVGYVVWVAAEFKGIGRKARTPGKPGGPEGLGMLVKWAEDYARIAGQRNESAKTAKGGAR